MDTGLDHALLCVACFVLNMLRYCVIVCYTLRELLWTRAFHSRVSTRWARLALLCVFVGKPFKKRF